MAQEQHDREFFTVQQRVEDTDKYLQKLQSAPDMKKTYGEINAYRTELSEKVLQKTVSNNVHRLIDGTLKNLQDVCPFPTPSSKKPQVGTSKPAHRKRPKKEQFENTPKKDGKSKAWTIPLHILKGIK